MTIPALSGITKKPISEKIIESGMFLPGASSGICNEPFFRSQCYILEHTKKMHTRIVCVKGFRGPRASRKETISHSEVQG
jgi:hypothetical protein